MEPSSLFDHLCCICAHNLSTREYSNGNCRDCSSAINWHNVCFTNTLVNFHGEISCIICQNTHNGFPAYNDNNSPLNSVDPDVNFLQSHENNACKYYNYSFFNSFSKSSWDKKFTLPCIM